jgi:hypothetical protein
MNVNLGATVSVGITPSAQLQLSYAHSVASNDYGMKGRGARTLLVIGF